MAGPRLARRATSTASARSPAGRRGWRRSVARRRARAARARSPRDGRAPFLVVHGDTMTTVLGALAGRALRRARRPRRGRDAIRRLAQPVPRGAQPADRGAARRHPLRAGRRGRWPTCAARASRGEIVDTGQNTIRDARRPGRRPGVAGGRRFPDEPFGLVSLHRFELIEREAQFRPLLELLREHSRHQPLLFVDHSTTAAVIDRSPALRAAVRRALPADPAPALPAVHRPAAPLGSSWSATPAAPRRSARSSASRA